MIRLLLLALGGLAAWRYRDPIKKYVNQQLPQLQKKATTLMGMTIEEASAKIRSSGPLDLEQDYAADCWAGTVPIAMRMGAPIPDAIAPPRTAPEPEVGHFAAGAAFDQVLLATARRGGNYG